MVEFIHVHPDDNGFQCGSVDNPFLPFGCNYFDPETGWPPHIWSRFDAIRVGEHLQRIADAGLTVIRVFLDTGLLSPGPRTYSDEGFDTVQQFIDLARHADLRIIFSGPSTWEGRPKYLGDLIGDREQVALRCDLWRQIARRFGDDPTIMAWDLFNEPAVGWPKPERSDRPGMAERLRRWQAFAKQCGLDAAGQQFMPATLEGVDRPTAAAYLAFQESLAEH